MIGTLQDNKLLEAARHGDAAALESLLVLCPPNLRRYAGLTCLTSADAEDAVQESLLIVYRRLSALRSIGKFSQWIFQIVRRECLRLLKPRHVDVTAVEEATYLSSHSDVELRIDITQATQSLPVIYREVLLLRDFEELTLREIAERLKVLSEIVKTRLYCGRHLVQEHLLA